MKTWQTTSGIKIYAPIRGRSNVYFIQHKNLNILVDTGREYRYPKLKKSLNILLKDQKLDYLFLSHTHYDHVENAAKIQKDFGPKIIVDEREKDFLKNGETPLPSGSNLFTRLILWLGKSFTKIAQYQKINPDVVVDDIYEIKTKDDIFSFLRTPGHSPGSVSLIVDNEIALVGDTLFGIFPASVFPPFLDNKEQLLKSWESLLKTDCQIFLPGHGFPIRRAKLEKCLGEKI